MKHHSKIVVLALSLFTPACDVEEPSDLEEEDIEERHTWWNFAFIRTHQPAWDLCMDIDKAGTAPGTLLNQDKCKSMTKSHFPDDINQRFRLSAVNQSSNVFQIFSYIKIDDNGQEVHNCVDLMTAEHNGGDDDDLTTSPLQLGSHGLIMDRCDDTDPRQQWQLIELDSLEPIDFAESWEGDFDTGEYHTYGRIRNVHNGECIDVPYGVDYTTPLQVYPCHTGKNQQWDIFQPLWFG